MNFSISPLTVDSTNMLDVKILVNYLSDFSEICFESIDTKFNDTDICFKILPDVILKIKKVKKEHWIKITKEMKVNCDWNIIAKNMVSILEKWKSLFILTEIVSHGITYFDSNEKINNLIEEIKQNLEIERYENANCKSNQKIQIILDNYKLEYLISLILNNCNKPLVFTPTPGDRCAISCFVLISLLHKENPLIKNQMCYISSENDNIGTEFIISTDKWITQNISLISPQQNLNISLNNKSSCLLVLNDCDVHCAVINYLNSLGNWFVISERPKLCLVQENVYEKFITLLNEEIEKSKDLYLLDKNRRLPLTYIENGNSLSELLKNDDNINLFARHKINNDQNNFHFPLIFDKVQPQNEIFHNKSYNNFCSFILTFRHFEEGLLLANKLFRHKSCVYLWTENISLCFDLKSKLEYEKICVNMIKVPELLSPIFYNIKCSNCSSMTKTENQIQILSTNQISLALELFKSKLENSNRFRRINDIIDKISDKLISKDSAVTLKCYLNDRIRSVSNYNSTGALHMLSDQMPTGNVILYLGNTDVNDSIIQLILLSWLLGNNVLVISEKELQNLVQSFNDINQMKSLIFINGVTSTNELKNCTVDLVVAFDKLIPNGPETLLDLNFSFLYMKVDEIFSDSYEIFDEVLNFVRKKKTMFILAGGINT